MSKYFFTAKWCSNCQVIKSFDYEDMGVSIIDVDTLEGAVLAEEKGIMSLPAFVNGDEVTFGIKPESEIRKFFK